jgi:hypothetical protein
VTVALFWIGVSMVALGSFLFGIAVGLGIQGRHR